MILEFLDLGSTNLVDANDLEAFLRAKRRHTIAKHAKRTAEWLMLMEGNSDSDSYRPFGIDSEFLAHD